jgi:preprotein translocase subunit SecG
MISALTVLHVFVCFFLVAVVLLQRGKGAEMGAVFGGGASSTVFGSRGAGTFLGKLTTGCAVVFMLTSLSLSYLMTQSATQQLFEDPIEELEQESSPFEQLGTVPAEDSAGADDGEVIPAEVPTSDAATGDSAEPDSSSTGSSDS